MLYNDAENSFYFIFMQEVPEVKVRKTTWSQLVPCIIRNFRVSSYLVAAAVMRCVITTWRTLTWLAASSVLPKRYRLSDFVDI